MSTATAAKSKAKILTIGAITDQLWQLREDKKVLAEKEKDINGQIDGLESQLYERMDAEGTTKSAGARASVSLGKTDVVQFDGEDGFDLLWKYAVKHKYSHLFERRIAQLAAREILATKGALPGTKVFTKRKITLTTTPSK